MGAGDLNPTGLTAQTILSRVRLPIPPRPLASILNFGESQDRLGSPDPAERDTAADLLPLRPMWSSQAFTCWWFLWRCFWMNKRWHQMGNIERLVVYGCVFLFSGMVFAPFLNLRMNGQGRAELTRAKVL